MTFKQLKVAVPRFTMHWSEMSLHKLTGQLNPLMATLETSVPILL